MSPATQTDRQAVDFSCRSLGGCGLPRDNLLQFVSRPAPVVVFMRVPTVVALVLMVTTAAGGVIPSHLCLFLKFVFKAVLRTFFIF